MSKKTFVKAGASSDVTVEDLKDALPSKMGKKVNDEILHYLNNCTNNVDIERGYLEDNFFKFTPLLKELTVRSSPKDYIDAIKYVSLLIGAGFSKSDAWKKTFPEKWDRMRKSENEGKYIHNIVNTFDSRPIIVSLKAKMAVSTAVKYAPMREKAFEHMHQLMRGKASPYEAQVFQKKHGRYERDEEGNKIPVLDKYGDIVIETIYPTVSPNVQYLAAAKIIEETRTPEDKTVKLEMAISDEMVEVQKEAANIFRNIASNQQKMLERGMSIDEVQKIGDNMKMYIDVDVEDS